MIDPAALSELRLIASDPALSQAFRSRHPDLAPLFTAPQAREPVTCPPVSAIRTAEITIFDNHPGGRRRKSKPNRYAMVVKLWTAQGKDVRFSHPQFRASATLLGGADLQAKAFALVQPGLRHPIAGDYALMLNDRAEEFPNDLFGPLHSTYKGEGTRYRDYAFVQVCGQPGWAAFLHLGEEVLALPDFDTHDSKGQALTGGAVFQSRYSLDKPTWRTHDSLFNICSTKFLR